MAYPIVYFSRLLLILSRVMSMLGGDSRNSYTALWYLFLEVSPLHGLPDTFKFLEGPLSSELGLSFLHSVSHFLPLLLTQRGKKQEIFPTLLGSQFFWLERKLSYLGILSSCLFSYCLHYH